MYVQRVDYGCQYHHVVLRSRRSTRASSSPALSSSTTPQLTQLSYQSKQRCAGSAPTYSMSPAPRAAGRHSNLLTASVETLFHVVRSANHDSERICWAWYAASESETRYVDDQAAHRLSSSCCRHQTNDQTVNESLTLFVILHLLLIMVFAGTRQNRIKRQILNNIYYIKLFTKIATCKTPT